MEKSVSVLYFVLALVVFVLSTQVTSIRGCPCSDTSLCDQEIKAPKKQVIAFSTETRKVWRKWIWDSITTVLVTSHDKELMCYAHSKNARYGLIVEIPANGTALINTDRGRHMWLSHHVNSSVAKHVSAVHFYLSDQDNRLDDKQHEDLLLEVISAFKAAIPGIQVSLSLPVGLRCSNGVCPDLSTITNALDLIIMHPAEGFKDIGHNEKVARPARSYLDALIDIEHVISMGVPTSKLIFTVSWFGLVFTCESSIAKDDRCLVASRTISESFGNHSVLTQPVKMDMRAISALSLENKIHTKWSNTYKTDYFNFYENSSGTWHQVWYLGSEALIYLSKQLFDLSIKGTAVYGVDGLPYSDKRLVEAWWATTKWDEPEGEHGHGGFLAGEMTGIVFGVLILGVIIGAATMWGYYFAQRGKEQFNHSPLLTEA